MPQYVARLGWPDGAVAEESIISPNRAAARTELERRGAHVFELKERSAAFGGFKRRRRHWHELRDAGRGAPHRKSSI